MLLRLTFCFVLPILGGACHTVPDPNDPARQARIDDCLMQCPGGDPEPVNTAYPPAPSEQADRRTSCERRCHSIP